MNKLFIFFFLSIFFSCEEKTKEKPNLKEEIIEIKETIPKKEKNEEPLSFFNKSCKFGNFDVFIKENDTGVQINSTINEEIYTKNISGRVAVFVETDVNSDGFNEFYCITNKGDIIGYSSYRNLSYGEINIVKKPFNFYPNCSSISSWEVKNKRLSLTFKNEEKELNIVRYKLELGETVFQLIAD